MRNPFSRKRHDSGENTGFSDIDPGAVECLQSDLADAMSRLNLEEQAIDDLIKHGLHREHQGTGIDLELDITQMRIDNIKQEIKEILRRIDAARAAMARIAIGNSD